MADVTVTYKGATISEISTSGTKTLKTGGKFCEDDITLQYVKPSGGGSYIGGTVAWNQLIPKTKASGTVAAVTVTNNGDGSWTLNGTANAHTRYQFATPSIDSTHKYLITGISGGSLTYGYFVVTYSGAIKSPYIYNDGIYKFNANGNEFSFRTYTGATYSNYVVKPQVFDLTAMFGSSIADYVYTLESGTAGAGIAWLKANGFFNSAYYPYDAVTLKSVETFAHPFKDSNGKIIGYFPQNFDLELRGIPKLDANNVLYYDGDEYDGNGTVTRKYGIRAYTSGDATDGSTMITDGTNTVYKLATPTTETV